MTAGPVIFPLFVRTKDSGEIASFNSIPELQFKLERIDVENEEYEVWDRKGNSIRLKVQEPLWLKAELSYDGRGVAALRQALLDFANTIGVRLPADLAINDFEGALKQICEAQENKKLARSPVRRFISRLKK